MRSAPLAAQLHTSSLLPAPSLGRAAAPCARLRSAPAPCALHRKGLPLCSPPRGGRGHPPQRIFSWPPAANLVLARVRQAACMRQQQPLCARTSPSESPGTSAEMRLSKKGSSFWSSFTSTCGVRGQRAARGGAGRGARARAAGARAGGGPARARPRPAAPHLLLRAVGGVCNVQLHGGRRPSAGASDRAHNSKIGDCLVARRAKVPSGVPDATHGRAAHEREKDIHTPRRPRGSAWRRREARSRPCGLRSAPPRQ